MLAIGAIFLAASLGAAPEQSILLVIAVVAAGSWPARASRSGGRSSTAVRVSSSTLRHAAATPCAA
jgi:hypothetical protein